jgi:SNF2 family DNA or RNA helicase
VLKFAPLPHQEIAVPWLIERNKAALFAGMGLGKSSAVLSALEFLFGSGDCKGVLIVAPLRVSVLTWPHEVKKWIQFHKWRVFSLRTKAGLEAWHKGEGEIFTINYESLPKICETLLKGKKTTELPVDTVVFDELSNAKSPTSKRIRAIRNHRFKFRRVWGLTGTPTPNGLLDVFSQIRLIDDGDRLGRSYHAFKSAHFEPVNPFSEYPKFKIREGQAGIIEKKISDIVLTLRSEDWLKIPPTTVEDVEVSLPPEVQKVYKKLEKELLVKLQEDFEVVAVNAAVLAGKLLQVTGGAVYDESRRVEVLHDHKIKALKKLYEEQGRKPLLVAVNFKHETRRILEAIPEAEEWNETSLERWNRGEIPYLVAHPKSIGHGLNLQAGGCRIVWFTLSWSRELYDQMNARLARTGQTEETRVFRLLVPGTIDDAVAEALRGKGEGQSEFLATLKNLQELSLAA